MAHQDSLLVYQTYRDEIAFLECAAEDSNLQGWYARSDRDDSITNCAKLRLKKWNGTPYGSSDEKDLEGFGTAYYFPKPSDPKKAMYSITDTQVKFITRKDGKTETPFVERIYFSDDGEMLKVERIDPTTVDWEESRVLASDMGTR